MLESLLRPGCVAVIGASRSPEKVGHLILSNLLRAGFQGDIVPVNPAADKILGLTCFPDARASDKAIDLAVVAVPRERVKHAVEGAVGAGARAIVIVTAGFREADAEGAELENAIATYCRDRGVRLLGPNCLGLINAHYGLNASFADCLPRPGGISVISQSGALCTAILEWSASRGLGLSKLASLGNKADLDETDFLRAFAEDEQTKVIIGFLESVVSGDRFLEAAETAASKKPVVILKSGVTPGGGRAASSHTGSLVGADAGYAAAFKRSGVIRAETFEALLDAAATFATQPLPKGNRVAVIANGGGPGIMAVDAAELAGLEVAALNGGTGLARANALPFARNVAGPITILGDAEPEQYAAAVRQAQDDDQVDAILLVLTPQTRSSPDALVGSIGSTPRNEKPVLLSLMGRADRQSETDGPGLCYPSPERAVAALKAMHDYASWLRRPPRVITRFPVNRRRVERIIRRHRRTRQLRVSEALTKEILRAYNFTVPPGQMSTTAEEAIEIAEKIGYPVAMKIVSPDITHKSDIGGVRLGLFNSETVRDAFDLLMLRAGQRAPEAELGGVYVERMCDQGREVILGMARDPQFGPMLMFGLGGIFVEVMEDVTFHIAPITDEEAMQMLETTRSFEILKGARGVASVDLAAIAISLQRISQLVTDFPEIVELDINPFIVGVVGTTSVVADARITLSDVGEPT